MNNSNTSNKNTMLRRFSQMSLTPHKTITSCIEEVRRLQAETERRGSLLSHQPSPLMSAPKNPRKAERRVSNFGSSSVCNGSICGDIKDREEILKNKFMSSFPSTPFMRDSDDQNRLIHEPRMIEPSECKFLRKPYLVLSYLK